METPTNWASGQENYRSAAKIVVLDEIIMDEQAQNGKGQWHIELA